MTKLQKVAAPPRRCILADRHVPGGGWHHVVLDGRATVVAYCPKCGVEGYLDDHRIAADGTVSPSVVCPREGCGFHDNVSLEGYEA